MNYAIPKLSAMLCALLLLSACASLPAQQVSSAQACPKLPPVPQEMDLAVFPDFSSELERILSASMARLKTSLRPSQRPSSASETSSVPISK